MSEKRKFEEILSEMRSDLQYFKTLNSKLKFDIINNGRMLDGTATWFQQAPEISKWVADVFIDKLFETDCKIKKFLTQVDLDENYGRVYAENQIKENLEAIASTLTDLLSQDFKTLQAQHNILMDLIANVEKWIGNYERAFEKSMIEIRNMMYETDWEKMKIVRQEDFIVTERKRYVSAREELEKAKQAVKNRQREEVLNHLRPTIDLALREKLGFKKIHPMYQFLKDADKFNLPLPSYTMLYDYFDEGTQRIHGGKLNTSYECQKALEFVAGFIEQLDLLDIPKKSIEEFKQKSKSVE